MGSHMCCVLTTTGLKILITAQVISGGTWSIFNAFHWTVWLAIMITGAGVGATLWAIETFAAWLRSASSSAQDAGRQTPPNNAGTRGVSMDHLRVDVLPSCQAFSIPRCCTLSCVWIASAAHSAHKIVAVLLQLRCPVRGIGGCEVDSSRSFSYHSTAHTVLLKPFTWMPCCVASSWCPTIPPWQELLPADPG